ncbi:TonB-dependent receptor [Hyphococcus sp.]|uniref:TonB-dependent receptor n=1 Tax=Hyphococcus sp. TaxID=2038636 RepID=UPI0035C69C92
MRGVSAVSIIALTISLASQSALAQANESGSASQGGLDTIVVTATKRAENLQDVPVAVSAVPAKQLRDQGVFETSDLNRTMPNFQVSSPFGQQQPNFTIRGVGVGTEFNANAASPVGVYLDEVYQTFRSSHGMQLYDLEQIEVLRGPQGTLYGRNTTGGAINFKTVAPSLGDTTGYMTVGYGSYDRVVAEGALEFSPITDTLGVRIAGTYVKSDPYVRNLLPAGVNTAAGGGASGLNINTGRDPGGFENWAVRGTVRFQPNDRMDVRLKVYGGESEGGGETPLATGQTIADDTIDYTSPNFLLGSLFGALAPGGLVPSSYSASGRGLNDLQIEADTVGAAYSKARGAVLTAKFQLSDSLELTSITSFDDGEYSQSETDCDATPLRLCAQGFGADFDAFNQDLRIDHNGGALKLLFGGYVGLDSMETDNTPNFFNSLRDVTAAFGLPPTYFNPAGAFGGMGLSPTSLPTGITATQHFLQERDSIAVYGEANYEILPSVKITAGLRYTWDDIDFSEGLTTYFDDTGVARLITVSDFMQGGGFAPYILEDVMDEMGNVVIPSFSSLGIPEPGPLEVSGGSNRLTGRAIIDWKPTDETLVYASYSRGYRAGTFNGYAYGSANQVYFVPPETVNAYELGFKSRFFDNRVQINGAFFYYDYEGQQGQVVDATATANLISFDGSMKGLEIESIFAVTDTFQLSASLGLLDTQYADFNGDCPSMSLTGFPAQDGSCVLSAAGPVSVAGNPFPYAAESTINLAADWDVFDDGQNSMRLHVDAAYTGQYYFDSFEDYSRGVLTNVITGDFTQGEGDYWVGNARVTLERGDIFSVSGFVKNFTDTTYYPFGIAIENLFGNGYRVRNAPRTYGVELTARF